MGNRSKVSLAHGATHSESSGPSGACHHPTGAGGGGAGGFQTVVETGHGSSTSRPGQEWQELAGTLSSSTSLSLAGGVGGVFHCLGLARLQQGSGMELLPVRHLLSRERTRQNPGSAEDLWVCTSSGICAG